MTGLPDPRENSATSEVPTDDEFWPDRVLRALSEDIRSEAETFGKFCKGGALDGQPLDATVISSHAVYCVMSLDDILRIPFTAIRTVRQTGPDSAFLELRSALALPIVFGSEPDDMAPVLVNAAGIETLVERQLVLGAITTRVTIRYVEADNAFGFRAVSSTEDGERLPEPPADFDAAIRETRVRFGR